MLTLIVILALATSARGSFLAYPYEDGIVESARGIFRRQILQDDATQLASSDPATGEVMAVPKTNRMKKRKRKKRIAVQTSVVRNALNASTDHTPKGTSGVVGPSEGNNSGEKEAGADQNTGHAPQTADPAGREMPGNSTESTGNADGAIATASSSSNPTNSEPSAEKLEQGKASVAEKSSDEVKPGDATGLESLDQFSSSGIKGSQGSTSDGAKIDDSDSEEGVPESIMQKVARLQSEKEAKATKFHQMKRDLKYLEKSLQLKRGESQAASSQVELDEDEIKVSSRQLLDIKETEERTTSTYHELKIVTNEMRSKAKSLSKKADTISDLTELMTARMQNLTVEEVLANSARGLPDSVAGALRRSAEALTPFMDTLMIAVDTNQRLVDHVGLEIDKFTHVNIKKSPFLSGIVFYCVLLIPTLTLVSFARRIFDSSSHLTVSHFIVFGNIYYMTICLAAIATACIIKEDPAASLHRNHEKLFVTFNLLLALYFMWHVGIMSLQAVYTREKRNAAQLTATLCIGLHYFLFTWRRIFTRASPVMIVANYGMYLTILAIITAERVNRVDMAPLWLRWRHSRSRSMSCERSSSETTLGAVLLFLSKNLLQPLTTGTASFFKSSTKSTWDSAPRAFRNRQSLLRPSQSDEDFESGDVAGRDIEASQTRRPQSARLSANSTTMRPKRRPSGQQAEKKGFPAMFFGSRDERRAEDESDEEGEDEDISGGWWDRLTRATGYSALPSASNERMRGRSTGGTGEKGRGRSSISNRGPPRRQTLYDSWFGISTPTTPRRDR